MKLNKLATTISAFYAKNSKVEAVLLAGSVSRNWHDEFSDIELHVFWSQDPDEEDRKAVIREVEGTLLEFHPYEEEEWSETYSVKGVKMEISNFLTKAVESIIQDVVYQFNTCLDKQCLVAAIHDGVCLYGEYTISNFKRKVEAYPKELGLKMIEKNINLGARWKNCQALLAREDWLMFYQVIYAVQTNVMSILFALNHLYVHHPAYKWQNKSLAMMKIKPDNIEERFNFIARARPKDRLQALESIVADLYPYIKSEYPNIDIKRKDMDVM